MQIKTTKLVWICVCSVLSPLAINVVYLALFGSYDFSLGSVHVVAREIFKPFRWFNVTLLLLFFLAPTVIQEPNKSKESFLTDDLRVVLILMVLIVGAYYKTLGVNLNVFEWDHRDISAKLTSPREFLNLFTTAQPNGFYRPVTYISFWLDYTLFKGHLWAYHLQNLLIHFLNSVAVLKLGKELGLGRQIAASAALFFSVSAINFEAVMWPAARFDLLATLFTLVATIYLLRYLRDQSNTHLVLSLACFVIAVLNKESAYCFPLIAAVLLFFPIKSATPLPGAKTRLRPFRLIMLTLGLLLILRFIVGFGGYRDVGGGSLHLGFNGASIFSFVMNALGLTQFAVNASVELSLPTKIAVIVFVLAALMLAVTARPSRRLVICFLCLVLVSALPVFTLLGWIRPSLQNARFLYLPAVWMSFVLAVALASVSRHTLPLLVAIVMSGVIATHHNVGVYRDMVSRAHHLAEFVVNEQKQIRANTIYLVGLPEAPDGVFYFPSELATKLKTKMPEVNVIIVPIEEPSPSAEAGQSIYKWNAATRTLERP